MRLYSDTLSATVNRKGVLDVDTVKGCAALSILGPSGCYDACYAATMARFRGLDFGTPVARTIKNGAHADKIKHVVRAAPQGFFRVGTMGEPSYAWEHTVRIVEWLAPFATPVIVTKHWRVATDGQFRRLIQCGAVLNTSVSALDTPAQLLHREAQIARYRVMGGVSVARVVSCDFNSASVDGRRLAAIQARLFRLLPIIDNPLRVAATHSLVRRGTIRVRSLVDLSAKRNISLARPDTYIGTCDSCPDLCGLAFCGTDHPKPEPPQLSLGL